MGETAELSTEEWKSVLAKLRAANIPQVTFTGGEPTLRDDLVALVREAEWFVTRLNTNGRLLTPELCRDLYEASLDSVQVTLYAADAATHNALVGAPGFDDTVQGIRSAVEAGLIVSINTPLCSLNGDYAATLRFAHSLGVRYATCSGLIPSGDALGEDSRATRLDATELTEILRDAAATAAALGMELDFTSPGWLDEETLRSLGLHLIPSCGACLSNMAVAPDGTVVPCQSWLGGVTLGHILQDDWSTIWDSSACRTIRTESAKTEHICQLHQGNRGGEAE
jgi:MoaA/NifB/PqqE/SkfB family radical SAM enzyme